MGGVGSSRTYAFNGLTAGWYTLYTYAVAPDNAAYRSSVVVAGSASPSQLVGGAIPVNAFAQGVTHAVHEVYVGPDSPLSVTITTTIGFGTVNGFQLVPGP